MLKTQQVSDKFVSAIPASCWVPIGLDVLALAINKITIIISIKQGRPVLPIVDSMLEFI